MHEYDRADLRESILNEIRRVAATLGHSPTIVEYKRLRTKHGYDQIRSQFGNWNAAVCAAGLEPNPMQAPPRNDIPQDKLIDELVRVANKLGKFPSHPEFAAHSRFSRSPVERRFKSWRKAIEYVVEHRKHQLQFAPELRQPERPAGKLRDQLGINLPLEHVPNNEAETFALFCMLAATMGYSILRAQTAFPDLVLCRDGREELAEVEFLSSNYLQHGHPLEAAYTCICWRKDCELPNVAIIDLESIVRQAAAGTDSTGPG